MSSLHIRWLLVALLLYGAAARPAAAAEDDARHSGPPFSLEFRDADLKDVLRALGQENGLNIIVADDVAGRVTLSFQRVGLWEALDSIVRANGLLYVREGNLVRVMRSPFADGEADLETRLVPINFSTAKDSAEAIRQLLSKKGTLSIDERTNTLILRDVPDNVTRIAGILKKLDSRTPQVLIEARIVEAATNFSRELGVQWGGKYTGTNSTGTSTVAGGVSQATPGGAANPTTGAVGMSGNNFIVNLPAGSVGGATGGGAIGFSFGSISNKFALDLQLAAMEDTGKGRILSNPKVLTLDNKEAKISSGTEILVPVTTITTGASSTGGTSSTSGSGSSSGGVQTINAKLELVVTPHVTPDNKVALKVKADKKDPDFSRTVQNIPPLTTRSAETNLLVDNGETVVIGGVYTKNEMEQERGIPWFSKIPVIGWLFKKNQKVENQTELLIFITPTIISTAEQAQAQP